MELTLGAPPTFIAVEPDGVKELIDCCCGTGVWIDASVA